MATLTAPPTALDDRVGELVSATSLASLTGQIVELLVEARDRIVAAEQLADRLPRSELLELHRRIDPALLVEFRRSMNSIDSSLLTVDLEALHGLHESLVDAASDLRQEIYDVAGVAHAGSRR